MEDSPLYQEYLGEDAQGYLTSKMQLSLTSSYTGKDAHTQYNLCEDDDVWSTSWCCRVRLTDRVGGLGVCAGLSSIDGETCVF